MRFVIIALLLVAVILGGVYLLGRLEPTVVATIESYGEAATGTDVTLRAANVSVTESTGTLSGLTIGNPEGYETDYALQIDEIRVRVGLDSLVGSGPLVVNEVVVNGARLNAEQRGNSSNLNELLERLEQSDDSEPSAEPEERVIIERFRLARGRITLTSELLEDEQYVDLPEVVVEDVGGSSGATYAEATEALLTPILAAARQAVVERVRDSAVEEATEEIEDAAREKLQELLQN
ncbi:MAG: hypothetical protein JXB36_07335 [Gammaproteobacteria bacterium]|nr:hypothetical protein [Gammaproteobacteria bacterium]